MYIGKHMSEPIYYFLSQKDGVGRFIRFAFSPAYPFWIGGVNTGISHTVPDRLSTEICPLEVWTEVKLFVLGKVHYEFKPSKRGKKATITRTEIQVRPNDEATLSSPMVADKEKAAREVRGSNSGNTDSKSKSTESSLRGRSAKPDGTDGGNGIRKRRGTVLGITRDIPPSKQQLPLVTPEAKVEQVTLIASPRRRGRPVCSKNKLPG